MVVVLTGARTRTAHPESRPQHPMAPNRPRRSALFRTSLASHSALLTCCFSPNHEDPTCLHGLDLCGFCYHNRMPSLATPYSSFHTPPRSCVLRHPSPVRMYMGSIMADGWFLDIIGCDSTNPKATLLTLTSSAGRRTDLGAFLGVPPVFLNTPSAKSRNGCTNLPIFTPRPSPGMITSLLPRCTAVVSPVAPCTCISPKSTPSPASPFFNSAQMKGLPSPFPRWDDTTLHYTSKCSTSPPYLKALAFISKNSFKNATGPLGTTSARAPASTKAEPSS